MSKRRTPADLARYNLYCYSKELRAFGIYNKTRDQLIEAGGSFKEVLAKATPNEIARITDDDALLIDDHDVDISGPLSGSYLIGLLGWDDEDIFFSESNESAQDISAPKGRPPSGWWPKAAGMLAALVHEEGVAPNQAQQEERLLQNLLDEGYPVSAATIRPAVSYLFRRLRKGPEQ